MKHSPEPDAGSERRAQAKSNYFDARHGNMYFSYLTCGGVDSYMPTDRELGIFKQLHDIAQRVATPPRHFQTPCACA
jgi:hypothetical protein